MPDFEAKVVVLLGDTHRRNNGAVENAVQQQGPRAMGVTRMAAKRYWTLNAIPRGMCSAMQLGRTRSNAVIAIPRGNDLHATAEPTNDTYNIRYELYHIVRAGS